MGGIGVGWKPLAGEIINSKYGSSLSMKPFGLVHSDSLVKNSVLNLPP